MACHCLVGLELLMLVFARQQPVVLLTFVNVDLGDRLPRPRMNRVCVHVDR